MDQRAEKKKKKKDGTSNRPRQKDKRGDSKVESNDSPVIPDRGGGEGEGGHQTSPASLQDPQSKLYVTRGDLQKKAKFIASTGLPVESHDANEKKKEEALLVMRIGFFAEYRAEPSPAPPRV